MSQIIENLNFFIMEKFYLVELFTFTKFQHHLSHILMNRHISLKYLYSISLTKSYLGPATNQRCRKTLRAKMEVKVLALLLHTLKMATNELSWKIFRCYKYHDLTARDQARARLLVSVEEYKRYISND